MPVAVPSVLTIYKIRVNTNRSKKQRKKLTFGVQRKLPNHCGVLGGTNADTNKGEDSTSEM